MESSQHSFYKNPKFIKKDLIGDTVMNSEKKIGLKNFGVGLCSLL